MDWTAAKFWLDFINFILTLAIGLYVYIATRHRVTNERIGEMERDVDTKLDLHSDRLARLETAMERAPTHEDLKRIHERIDQAVKELAAIGGEFKGVAKALQLIQQHLIDRSR